MSQDQDCQTGFTSLDMLHAQAYADAQIAKMKCVDPEIIEKVCAGNAGGGQCVQWEQDEKAMIFPKPENYYINSRCTKDEDCYQGKCKNGKCVCSTDKDCIKGSQCLVDPDEPSTMVCGYAPADVAAGHCVFATPDACTTYGMVPFTCNCGTYGNSDGDCQPKPKKDLKPYLEWHEDLDTGKGKCVLGNFTLKQWCEYPCTRCKKNKDTGKYPPSCHAGPHSRGVTDVPPFFYDDNTSQCYMTKEYCDWYAMDYSMDSCSGDDPNECTTKYGPGHYCNTRTPNPHCTGPGAHCYVPGGDKVAEFLVGKTLFYMMKKGTVCASKPKETYVPPEEETYNPKKHNIQNMMKSIHKELNKTPKISCTMYDQEMIKRKKKVADNFAGSGIHLYIYEKNNGKVFTGFDPNEVEKKYPQCVERHPDGKMVICVEREEIKDDKNLKRIYLSLSSSSWMSKMILWGAQLGQLRKSRE